MRNSRTAGEDTPVSVKSCTFCSAPLQLGSIFCSRCGNRAPVDGADLSLESAFGQASAMLSQGDVDRAIALLEPHTTDGEADPRALFGLGAAYLQRGRYADALPLLLESTQLNPGYARGHAYLAMSYLHCYDPAEARAAMDKAVSLAPDDFVVNLKHGEMLMRLGYYRECIEPLERALSGPSPDPMTLDFARRMLLLARQKAPNTYTRPVGRFPKLPRFWQKSNRGDRLARGDPSAAS
jgi:tetratricopeptide (TPR) repeat protein